MITDSMPVFVLKEDILNICSDAACLVFHEWFKCAEFSDVSAILHSCKLQK